MAFKIRSSKFRHVFGSPCRKEHCYENVRITRNAHDSSFCAVNPKSLAVVTESAGGGAFVVLPVERTGRVDITAPKVSGHAGAVLDIKWNPFNDDFIASASEDSTVKLWQIPKDGLVMPLTEWWVDLHGHSRRVGYLEWHPTAENILLSAGYDYKCIVWNVEQAEPVNIVDCHRDTIFSISWNRDGSLFATTSKDKKLRTIDPRTCAVACEAQCHKGPKASKVVFVDNNKMVTTGFSQMSERQLALWDLRQSKTSLHTVDLDSSCGVILPYFDYDTRVVFLAGKGDGNIRYYEVSDSDSSLYFLNTYQASSPQRGLGVMPKRGCDVRKCEITRFYKLHAAKNLVEPISMIVPRKSDVFQEDVFPATASTIPSLRADEWIAGQNREPILVSLQDGHVTNNPKITTSKAVQKQDGALQNAPTITTYKAVDRGGGMGMRMEQPPVQFQRNAQNSAPVMRRTNASEQPGELASLKNIKRLSLNEDFVTVPPNASSAVPSVVSPSKSVEKKVYSPVTPPGAEPSTNGVPLTSDTEHDFSPFKPGSSLRRTNSGSSYDFAPARVKGDLTSGGSSRRHNPVTRSKTISSPYEHASQIKLVIAEPSAQSHANKIHIRKTWHPPAPSLQPVTESGGDVPPNADAELKKAYFRQLEEIRSLKEQVVLKDKRIRQLEMEVVALKETDLQPGSNC
ncbi:hypothetical protein V1264_005768 [Littorina saxatilis]|uniref:Coronin n=1 Tax=Littorina saxatilis TaxID=31220 RepID=A0AAN9AZV1_9CAEN